MLRQTLLEREKTSRIGLSISQFQDTAPRSLASIDKMVSSAFAVPTEPASFPRRLTSQRTKDEGEDAYDLFRCDAACQCRAFLSGNSDAAVLLIKAHWMTYSVKRS